MSINFNRINQFVTLAALCLFIIQFALAQKPNDSLSTSQQIVAKADEYMNDSVKIDNFTGAVLVARDGQPIFSKAYGMANYELDVPNKPETVFRIGSITKQFTAMAIMMLQERGKLSVNDSICKHLKECPESWKPITIRNLLTHTSGIINYGALPEFRTPGILYNSEDSIIALFKNKPLEFTPSEKFTYSNSGYLLLGKIIEQASGKDYDEFLEENIFIPVSMKNTGEDGSIRIIKNRASGYQRQGNITRNPPYAWVGWSAGSIFSTTEDLLLWEQALYTEKLVKRKSLNEMLTPFKDFLPGTSYAYGWIVGKQFDRQMMTHSGHGFGFAAYIIRFPSDKVTVIVLSNDITAPSASVGNALAAIVFGAPYKSPNERKMIPVEAQTLQKYVGQYQISPSLTISIEAVNKRMIGRFSGLGNFELYPKSETAFFFKHIDGEITFIKDAEGKVTSLRMNSDGRDISAQKIK